MSQAKQQGLYPKYFVLKPRGDGIHAAASRKAMRTYARAIKDIDPVLAKDLLQWSKKEKASWP